MPIIAQSFLINIILFSSHMFFPSVFVLFNLIGSFGPFYPVELFNLFGYVLFTSFPIIMIVNGLGLSNTDNYKTLPLLLFTSLSYFSTRIKLDPHFDSTMMIPRSNPNHHKENNTALFDSSPHSILRHFVNLPRLLIKSLLYL